jgi:dTDP-glucose 4,6-dehydratase
MSNLILITGSGGFIGSHLTERVLARGGPVRAFLRYNSARNMGNLRFLLAERQERLEIVFGDLRDADAVRQAMAGADTVFHLGALIAIPYSYLHPRDVFEVNVTGTLNVLTTARDLGVQRVIHTSTSEVFGTARYVPIDENHPRQGQSPYSASKIAADALCESFYCSYETPVTIVRPFNTYGPRQSARAVIPTIISQALTQDVVKLGALHPTRDLTFVTDTAEGFIKAAECEEAVGQEFNLGVGETISIGDLAQKILELIGRDVRIAADEQRLRPEKSEVLQLLSNHAKAKRILGWEPQVGLEEGLRQTIDWVAAHLALFVPNQYVV